MITAERLRELLDYEPVTGIFRWRVSRGGSAKAGTRAGTLRPDGYRQIHIDCKLYLEHWLAWLHVHGEFRTMLDHKDMDRAGNWIENLRPATKSQNTANSRSRRSGLKGAYFFKRTGRWVSGINANGVKLHLGYFDTEIEAHQAYLRAAEKVFGEFARAA